MDRSRILGVHGRRNPVLRRTLPLLALGVLAAACGRAPDEMGTSDDAGALGPGPSRSPGAPVILITLDALDGGHVGHLGYERDTTPNLDALAAEGFSFERAVAPAPYTLASIPSLLTGRLPDTHGLVRKTQRLLPEEVTLAEVLQVAGYRTFAAVANPNGSSLFGCEQGFDVFVEVFRKGLPDVAQRDNRDAGRDDLALPRGDLFPPLLDGWIDGLEGAEPFFFYMHLLEPHAPYAPPEPFRSRWLDPGYDGPLAAGDSETLVDSLHGRIELTDADMDASRALYDGNLFYGDSILGELLEALREAGLYDRSYIVVTSDHGEAFWQHGRWGHNDQLFEEMVRVPLVIKPPLGTATAAQQPLGGLASIVDVLPSLCDWLELQAPPGRDGLALAGLFEGRPEFAERELFLRTNADFPTVGMRSPGTKSILTRDPQSGQKLRMEHYDLLTDPSELSPKPSAAAENLAERERAVQRWARIQWERARERGDSGSGGLSDAERELLRNLGYEDE